MQPAGLAGVNDLPRICDGLPMRKHGPMTTEAQIGRDVIAPFLPQSPFVAKLGIVADQLDDDGGQAAAAVGSVAVECVLVTRSCGVPLRGLGFGLSAAGPA